ncbi:MAG TPA: SLBB domain-containing protein [Candidatus Eisenbacteria bacterium]
MTPFAAHRRRPGAIVLAALALALGVSAPAVARAQAAPTTDLAPAGTAPDAGVAREALPEANPPIAGRVDPATYRIGPGDEIALRFSELAEPRVLRVGPAGDLILPDVGAVPVAGLTLAELDARVRELMRPYVRGKGLGLSLFRPRRFRLFVLGDVARPGAVTVQAPVRASEAIATAGGVAPGGARRGIEVRRGPDTLRVDLVRATRAGSLERDPLVFETDVVFVPPAGRHVDALGSVAHPDRFDFVPGDRLSDLVAVAGGLLPDAAADQATLERFDDAGATTREGAGLPAALASPGGDADPPLRDGDRLFVPGRVRWHEGSTVTLVGEVARPGPYPITPGRDRVRALLEQAGGYGEEADTLAVRVERDRALAPPDTAFLRLARESEQLLSQSDRDYVVLSAKERRAVSADVGALLARGDERGDVLLANGDRIVVPRRFPFVSVQGEVRRPGYVPFVAGNRVSDYVSTAGGFTSRANRGRVRVTLATTGRLVGAREAGELRAGDVVWVPAKEEKSFLASFRDFLTTAAQAATIYLVIHQATK